MENEETSEGLILLLVRNKVYPTFNYKRDVELARKFMPPNYNEYLKQVNDDKLKAGTHTYYHDQYN